MEHLELVLLGLLIATAGLAVVARVVQVPYPILLTLGGLVFGFLPGLPEVELDPELVLLVFLPPLLYSAAFFSNLRELRANARPIGLLAIGLVIATTGAVAVVGHAVIGLDWTVSFVLGAIVSPTDAVAPATILRRLGVPRRVVTVVEGENLTNDWTALVTYKFAVAAAVTGSFSLVEAGPRFVLTGVGGVVIGVAVGWVVAAVRRRLEDPLTEITISLLTAYAAYLPAEELGVSGVLAAVTTGVWLGWQASELTTHTTRLQLTGIWELLQFLLHAVLFMLVGLQMGAILESIDGSASELAGYGALICAVVILVRIAWVYISAYLPRRLSRARRRTPPPPWSHTTLVAWSGMRGAVSLAAALAIPLETDAGTAFPERDLVVFLVFCVILATLVGQGLAMPALIRALKIEDDGLNRDEELSARLEIAFAALDRIDELEDEDWVHPQTVERTRSLFDYRRRRFTSRIGAGRSEAVEDDFDYEGRADTYSRFMTHVLGAQRERLRRLRDEGRVTDEVRRRVEYDLDLEEARLSAELSRGSA
ncbi:MAG: Na+/H+ antiporter [Actinomycetota bacterium]|nr:Na+/H+ antiporter [Actinomycetota bacterium]